MKDREISSIEINKIESPSEDWTKCCRICHSEKGKLLTICNCKGSLAFVHEKCELQWLQVKNSANCEICFTELNVEKVHKDFFDWITLRGNRFRIYLYMDIICCLIIVPIVSVTLCDVISTIRIHSQNQSLNTVCAILFFSFFQIIIMFILWAIVCLSHHFIGFYDWSDINFKYILKKSKVETEVKLSDNGLDGERTTTSWWSSLFLWFMPSNINHENSQQINQI